MNDTAAAAFTAPDFRALFENAPNLYMVLDPQLRIVAVSDAYNRATMTTRDQMVGRGLFEVFPDNPDDPDADGVSNLHASLSRVLATRRPDAMPIQHYDVQRPATAGGAFEERHWSVLNSPVIGPDGQVRWIIHRADDVTEFVRLGGGTALSGHLIARLRDANAALPTGDVMGLHRDLMAQARLLRDANSFFDVVIENIPAMIAVKDAKDLRFVLLNRAGEEITGIPRGESLGKNDFDMFPPEQAAFFTAKDREVLDSGEVHIIADEAIDTRYRGRRYLTTTKVPVFDEAGRPKYLVAMSNDITAEKQAAEALQTAEGQLRQALKMEAIGNLTGGLAHDFNNLLSVVIGNLDLLREELTKGSALDELANEALTAALRGAELTRRLLAFARRQPLQPKIVDVNELIDGVSKLLSRTLGTNVEIGLKPGTGMWPVVVDPVQLEACLVNLAANARDAMPKGGKLTISTDNRHLDADYAGLHPGLAAGDYTLIEVSDTGSGMPRDVLDKIFEPFFTTKTEGKGTGLGLSMVFGFMKQSNGHINVYSEVGVGTTFRLYLPRAMTEAEATVTSEAANFALGAAETILAVEDNPRLRALVAKQLKQLGYTCLEAEDGPSAVKMLETHDVDLLFTDVIMPGGMSGYDLGRLARTRWPNIRVLLTSGFPEEKINGNGQPPWNMRLLLKPYRKEDLALMLREVLAETLD
jgi:PAS domain S-box-containing protein